MTITNHVRVPAQAGSGFRPKTKLGFNTRVSFNDHAGPAQGLRDGIELYRVAEALGYQSGWSYQRHFDHYLSSPLPFFAAVGQHTSRIQIGSAVIPMRYQEPVLLAEAAATTDLLIDGRLLLAVSASATGHFDAIFGPVDTHPRTEAQRRLGVFLQAVSGEVLHTVDGPDQGAAIGQQLRVTPHSPTLRSRVSLGVSSLGSALKAAELGLKLMLGTVVGGKDPDETFSAYQVRIIEGYRSRWAELHPTPAPPVALAASVLPGVSADARALYAAYDHQRRTEGMAASRPAGALAPALGATLPPGMEISPVFHGDPDEVIAAVRADPALAIADELVAFLPPAFGLQNNHELLRDIAQTVAPALGWSPNLG